MSTHVDVTDGVATATSAVSFNVLQVIVVAAAIGIAAVKVGEQAKPLLTLTDAALAIAQGVLRWIVRLAPLGTLALIGNAIASYDGPRSARWPGSSSRSPGDSRSFSLSSARSSFAAMVSRFASISQGSGVRYNSVSSAAPPSGTLPLTQRIVERNLGVPSGYASFATPLGATTKMDGCPAIYPAIAAIFVAQFYGIQLSLLQYALIVAVSMVGSAATAGTTGAIVMLTLTLSTLGLPLDGVGLLLAVDAILDMGRTAVNVAGQALVPTIVAKREGILNQELYDAPRTRSAFSDQDAASVAGTPSNTAESDTVPQSA